MRCSPGVSASPARVPERRECAGSRPCPSISPLKDAADAQNPEQGSPEDPTQHSGGPQTSLWQKAGCRATQGSHSARATSSTARATVTTDQHETGKIPSPRSLQGAQQNGIPPR